MARIKHWAAVTKFKMSEEDAGEHMLQVAGTRTARRRAPTSAGSLPVPTAGCGSISSLTQRVNGSPLAHAEETR